MAQPRVGPEWHGRCGPEWHGLREPTPRFYMSPRSASVLLQKGASMTTRNPLLRNVLQLIPLPLPAALLIACSGSAALDTSPPEEGDSELALSAARDGVTDKSQRDRSPTR